MARDQQKQDRAELGSRAANHLAGENSGTSGRRAAWVRRNGREATTAAARTSGKWYRVKNS